MKQKFVDIAYIAFALFIIAMATAFLYTVKMNKNSENNYLLIQKLQELRSINKEFNIFLNKRMNYFNYDKINKKVHKFEVILEELDKNKIFAKKEVKKRLRNIKNSFSKKVEIIEEFKTFNSLLANSVHYLFELSSKLQKRYYFSPIGREVSNVTLSVTRNAFGEDVGVDKIKKHYFLISDFKEKYELVDDDLKIFLSHTNLMIKYLKKIDKTYEKLNKLFLDKNINDLKSYLIAYLDKNAKEQRNISYTLYFIVFVFLIFIIVIHTSNKRHKNELSKFKKAVEDSDNSIIITDENRNITYVNDSFEKITGYKKREVLGKNPKIFGSGLVERSIYDDMNEKLNSGKRWEGELINKKKDGSIYYEQVSISPIFEGERIDGYLAIKLDVTEYIKQKELIKNKSEEIQFLAYNDHLTKLPNRIHLQKSLDHAIKSAKRNKEKLALLFIDLDRFKVINDTLGHHIGDKMLKIVSFKIKDVLRESDILSRVGGDEFVVVLENVKNISSVSKVAEKIISTIKEPIFVDGYTLNTSASIGIAIYPDDGEDVQTIIKNSDSAMYKAKDEGKNNYQFFTQKLSDTISYRLKIENALREALQKNELFLAFQPQYDLKTKKTVSVEALVRWISEDLGFVSPAEFIPIAEESGLIISIGEWVFENSCKELLRLKNLGIELERMCINVSSICFRNRHVVERFVEVAQKIGVEAKNIEIEITERYIMEHNEQNLNILDNLRDKGFNISVDDFGTGYSSMGYLKNLPLDTLKIDKSFIDNIPDSEKDVHITNTIITLCKNLGYSVVAEGIENKEQEDFLRTNGCDLGQGYYFSKPLSSYDLEKFLTLEQISN